MEEIIAGVVGVLQFLQLKQIQPGEDDGRISLFIHRSYEDARVGHVRFNSRYVDRELVAAFLQGEHLREQHLLGLVYLHQQLHLLLVLELTVNV